MRIFIYILTLFIIILTSQSLNAQILDKSQNCICKEQSDNIYFEQSILIINAIVTSKNYNFPNRIYNLDIKHTYKGSVPEKGIVILTGTNKCAANLVAGKRYVFYINKIIDENSVFFNKCHLYYELNDKTISEERHIELMNLAQNYSKEQEQATKEEKPTKKSKFTDLIEGKHEEEKINF